MIRQNPQLLDFDEEDEEGDNPRHNYSNQYVSSGFMNKVLRFKPEKSYEIIMREFKVQEKDIHRNKHFYKGNKVKPTQLQTKRILKEITEF